MTEDEKYREKPDYLLGRIETLEQVLRLVISTMPHDQRTFVFAAAEEFARKTREIAERGNTDPLRDRADAAYDYVQSLESSIDDWGSHWDEIRNEARQEP
jgi:hypothetical protein